MYRQSKQLEDWKKFKEIVKRMKCYFFNTKIDEIANKKCGPWEFMNWVKKRKLPVIKAIQYNSCPCIELENLWEALYNSFNSAQNHQIDTHLLKKYLTKKLQVGSLSRKQNLSMPSICYKTRG